MCVDKIKHLESLKKFEICQKLHLTYFVQEILLIIIKVIKLHKLKPTYQSIIFSGLESEKSAIKGSPNTLFASKAKISIFEFVSMPA